MSRSSNWCPLLSGANSKLLQMGAMSWTFVLFYPFSLPPPLEKRWGKRTALWGYTVAPHSLPGFSWNCLIILSPPNHTSFYTSFLHLLNLELTWSFFYNLSNLRAPTSTSWAWSKTTKGRLSSPEKYLCSLSPVTSTVLVWDHRKYLQAQWLGWDPNPFFIVRKKWVSPSLILCKWGKKKKEEVSDDFVIIFMDLSFSLFSFLLKHADYFLVIIGRIFHSK